MQIHRRSVLLSLMLLLVLCRVSTGQQSPSYFPTKDTWEKVDPAKAGFDAAKLEAAVEWAKLQETDFPRDFSAHRRIFGRPLGPLPESRALTNGVVLRNGYIVAEWGETAAADPTYSVAKSYLSTLLGLTIDRGMIANVNDPVGKLVHDGGYESAHNAKVTWHHHATQTSEWEGSLFGKDHAFLGETEYGESARKPRPLEEPGARYEYNDVRINRLALSLLSLWKKPLPEVLRTEIMDKIGASDTWKWIPYDNATVDIEGTPMPSVSGGTRWGGGLWISARDHARFGLLVMNKGRWNDQQIISEEWVERATKQQGVNKEYGYLWWLNTTGRWPGVPASSFSAQGAGNNTIWIDPEHSIVVVWRWHAGGDAQARLYAKILEALAPAETVR
ncbi:MAG: serine hydrolase domain-containing protein [Phycisphaerales bacterium]